MPGIPRLFASTGILPDVDQSGLSDAPDPETVEFASPARAGIEVEGGAPAEPQADEQFETPVDPGTATDIPPSNPAPKRPSREYSHVDDEAEPEAADGADDGFSPELLEQASKHGYDADAARKFGTPDNLQWAIAQNALRMAQWGEQHMAAQAPQQPQPQQFQQPPVQQQQFAPPQQAPQVTPQQAQQVQQQAAEALAKFEIDRKKLVQQGFDDETIQLLTGMNDHYHGELSKFAQMSNTAAQLALAHHQQFTAQSQGEVNARDEAFVRDLDAFFAGLGPDWQDEFGNGTGQNLVSQNPNSPQLAKRREIASKVRGLQFAEAQSNQPPSTIAQLAQLVHSGLHFKKQQELALKGKAAQVQQRRTQAIARPGGVRSQQPMTGREKAFKRAEAFARKAGI